MVDGTMMRGFAFGLAVAGWAAGLYAATVQMPKAYLVGEVNVADPEMYKGYAGKTGPIIAKFGGAYIARAGRTVAVEGYQPAGRVVLIEFPSLAAAEAYQASPEYRAIAGIRQRSSTSHLFLVEGVAR